MLTELAGRREDRMPWLRDAACRGAPREAWFPVLVKGQHRANRWSTPAYQVCDRCPVGRECDDLRRSIPLVSRIWNGVLYNKGVAVDG